MLASLFEFSLFGLAAVLSLAILIVLIQGYRRTRNAIFLWVGAAIVVWPAISSLLEAWGRALMGRFQHGELAWLFPFSLVKGGYITMGALVTYVSVVEEVVRSSLLLIALLYLYRTLATPLGPASKQPTPNAS